MGLRVDLLLIYIFLIIYKHSLFEDNTDLFWNANTMKGLLKIPVRAVWYHP